MSDAAKRYDAQMRDKQMYALVQKQIEEALVELWADMTPEEKMERAPVEMEN